MAPTLTAHEKPISKVFSSDYTFSIPGYQRPYAWRVEQARDLFEDLTGAMQAHAGKIADAAPYFLDSIVLIKGDSSDADVVDGQQRLTTLTILLSALRARMSGEEAQGVTPLIYQKGNPILAQEDHFRLTLRSLDCKFFRDYVQIEGGFEKLVALQQALPDAQQRIRENAVFFEGRVKNFSPKERIDLATFIANRCYLVVVCTPGEESAFRIFSVLNSRGLDLSATDILKADVLSKVSESLLESYTKKWEETEESLGRDGLVSLFGHIRMIYSKTKPKGTLLSEFRFNVSDKVKPTDLVDNVVLPMAAAFDELTHASYTSQAQAEQINMSLKWLGRLEFSDWVPPAIAFTVRHKDDPSCMRSFVADLERLGYSMLIRRIGTNERIERFSELTREIEDGADLASPASQLQLTAEERGRTLDALNGPLYASMSARACALLLVRLDALLAAEGITHDYPVITVEHVLPQNPAKDSQWLAWFPDDGERRAWTDRLGNLALLSRRKNSAAQNYDFQRKKVAYFTKGGVAPFPLTTQVLQHETWTPGVLEVRQNDLVGTLAKHWRLH